MEYLNKIVFPRESDNNILLIILDGLADIPIEGLGYLTPLEIAKTPNLDEFARMGQTGMLWPYIPWTPLGSGPAHLALLGYDPLKNYVGRGPLEALGFGIDTEEDDVIVRLNFSTVDEQGIVTDRRAGRIKTELSKELFQFLNENMDHSPSQFADITWRVESTRGYRGVIILKNATSWIQGADPRKPGKPVQTITAQQDDDVSKRTARFMNWFLSESKHLLHDHPINRQRILEGLPPANHLLSRGAGKINYPDSFATRYKFKNPAFISGYPLYAGLAKFLGMEIHRPGGKDIISKFEKATEIMPNHDIVILHVKDPDIAGEDGNPVDKIKAIEEIDNGFGYILKNHDRFNDTIAITADHATPAKIADHSGHPVPLAISGPYCGQDDVRQFSERECAKGSLGLFNSTYFMNLVLMITLRLRTFGA